MQDSPSKTIPVVSSKQQHLTKPGTRVARVLLHSKLTYTKTVLYYKEFLLAV